MTPRSAALRLLGLSGDVDADAVRAARRRLAKRLHPDRPGGDAEAMRRLNAAADTLLAVLDAPADKSRSAPATPERATPGPTPPPSPSHGGQFDHDVASFTIEALPVVAFEALLVVTTWIGEVVVDEPPYQLDVVLTDPLRCWCRLDLVPDAGASTVAVTIAALPGEPLPPIDTVRDLWVVSLNQLGADPGPGDGAV